MQSFTTPTQPITSTTPNNLLVVDFDDTCTAEDTSSAIIKAAIASTAQLALDPHDSTTKGEALLQFLVNNYVDRRNTLLKEILPGSYKDISNAIITGGISSRDTVPSTTTTTAAAAATSTSYLNTTTTTTNDDDEFDMSWLGDFLDRLSDFDRDMNNVVINSNILSGIPRGTLAQRGQTITLRPGCVEILRHAVHAGIPTAVVSVNWSSELVQSVLMHHGLTVEIAQGGGGVAAGVQGIVPSQGTILIYANELEYTDGDTNNNSDTNSNSQAISTGNIIRRCECASDKGRIFDDLLLSIAAEGTTDQHGGVSIYIGDSMTDLTALISADIGIVLGQNRLIRHVIAASKIPLRPLMQYPIDPGQRTREEVREEGEGMPVLYEVDTWMDVGGFLFGMSASSVE